MPSEQYEELVLHPQNQFSLERLKLPYYMWLRFRAMPHWQRDLTNTLGQPSYHMSDSILQRLDDIDHAIGDNLRKVYNVRINRGHVYDNDVAGMLDFVKNAIQHCNDEGLRRVWQKLEEAITSAFPELALYLTNYCLIKKISMKELFEDTTTDIDFEQVFQFVKI